MKRLIVAVMIACFMISAGCSTLKEAETSGKVDTQVAYYESWLVGAQALLPLFGPYTAQAQVAIATAHTALQLFSVASDMYASGKLSADQVSAAAVQVTDTINAIIDLGNKAGIQQ